MSTKEKVLAVLREVEEQYVSGENLAENLGLSRNAIWKAIKSLQNEGHVINAVTNKGYCLSMDEGAIYQEGIKKYLHTEYLGHNVVLLDTVDSTNNYAKKMAAEGAPYGTVVIAQLQTAGKGRFADRVFCSPRGSGIYMTIILKPGMATDSAPMITSCAAVAVANAVEKTAGVDAKIKWVNDVYAGGKKLCGILTEAAFDLESRTLQYAVVGIGININNQSFPENLKDVATSVEEHATKQGYSKNMIIAEVLNYLEDYYNHIDERTFLNEYRLKSNVIGKKLDVISANDTYKATALEINNDGCLVVEKEDGSIKILNSGEVSIRT